MTTPPPTSVTQGRRFPGLDGLRAIAVVLVIVFHLTPGLLPGGYIGVDVFFVISGFLITGLLLREKVESGRIALGAFWLRRARRLLPALLLVVIVSATLAWLVASVTGGRDVLVGLGRQVLGAGTFSYNWLAIGQGSSYFDETTPELLRNLWSLAVEEQFYLLWPLVVLLLVTLSRARWRLAVVAVLATTSSLAMFVLYTPGDDATRVYYGTDTHSFGLAIGAVLAIVVHTVAVERWPSRATRTAPVVGALALAAIVVAAIVMPAEAPFAYQGGLVLVALLSALAIACGLVPGTLLDRTLELAPVRWIGERSYGLYLWHWPVVVLVGLTLPAWQNDSAGQWAIGGIALAITVLAAALSYRFVEQPIRREGFRGFVTGRWPQRSFIAGVTVIALSALTVTAIVSDPGTGEAQSAIEAGQQAVDEAATPPANPNPADVSPVVLPGGNQIYAIGDSVMLAAAPQLQEAFPGIAIDAVVSRQMQQVPGIVEGLVAADAMRPILVIGLGTNGSISRDTLDTVSTLIDSSTQVVLVNVQAPRGWTPGVNEIIAGYAQEKRNVELANWFDAIQPQLDSLARDRIHPGGPITGGIYAGAVRDALQRLAELPPLLGTNDYGLSPSPI